MTPYLHLYIKNRTVPFFYAALYAKEKAKEGKLTLDHVRRYHKALEEAGIVTDRVAPMILPDYSNPKVRERQLLISP
jgi:hypothetical protein